jgi:hypothetical protein
MIETWFSISFFHALSTCPRPAPLTPPPTGVIGGSVKTTCGGVFRTGDTGFADAGGDLPTRYGVGGSPRAAATAALSGAPPPPPKNACPAGWGVVCWGVAAEGAVAYEKGIGIAASAAFESVAVDGT